MEFLLEVVLCHGGCVRSCVVSWRLCCVGSCVVYWRLCCVMEVVLSNGGCGV